MNDQMSSNSEQQTPEDSAAGTDAAEILQAWRQDRARAAVGDGAPIADQLGPLATAAGGRPLAQPVTGWRYTAAGRLRLVLVAEELEGWELPDGSALILEPEPHAEPAPEAREVTGQALRAWREREGLSIPKAAERLSTHQNTWRRWERDEFEPAGPARILLADLIATLAPASARRGRRRK